MWPGRPRFQWIVRGARCYDPRKDSTVGGSGAHRRDNPATWEWSDNPIVTRYNWARGFYACDRVNDQSQLLVGRGLSATEAPPQNVFARANLCDELVEGEKRYTVGGVISATEAYIEVEEDFAAACAGTIVQPEGCVEIDPGEARAIVATFTDDDIVTGSRVRWNHGLLSTSSDEWVNTVVATYIEPSQKWAEHSAPVRRDPADIIADRQPREERIMLGFVTRAKHAGRVAEIRRRLGRLLGRAEVTLPPRFAFIEEGDWIAWQSNRRFAGATRTFRVEAWGSGENWHHQLTLRQISASVYSDTAPLDDGSVAFQQPPPPLIPAPAIGSWHLTAGSMQAGGIKTPALIVSGANDDPAARFVQIEYVQGPDAPTALTQWTDAGVTGPDVTRREIAVAAGGIYHVAVSNVVDSVRGSRLVLGPVTAPAVTYPGGTPVEDLEPAEPGATEGAVVPTPGSGAQGNIKDENGDTRPASDLLNTSMALSADGLLEIIREGGPRTNLGQVKAGAIGAASEGAARLQSDALERLAAVVTMIDTRLSTMQGVIRDAGIYVDPTNGLVTISALDATAERVNDVSIVLDAVQGFITLSAASKTYVDTSIATAVIDPSQIPVFDQINVRITSAEFRLAGLDASLLLKADATIVNALSASLTTASLAIDALEGAITTKVDAVDFGELATRVTSAEESLTALGDTASINRAVSVVHMVEAQQEEAAALGLLGVLAGDRAQREVVAALATAREEITTRLIDGDNAEAQARLVLAAKVGATDAALIDERTIRAAQYGGLAQSIVNLTVNFTTTTNDLSAAVADEEAARIDADGAAAERIEAVEASIETEVQNRQAAVTGVSNALADAEQALAERLDTVETSIETELTSLQAAISGVAQALIDGDQALAGRLDTVEASIETESGARQAAIEDVQQAMVAGDEAIASALTTIGTKVGEHSATIEEFGESIDGLSLRAGIKLDVNGRWIGYVLNNNGAEGGMDMVVDRWRVWSADGTLSKAPFEFRNGGLYVSQLSVDSLSVAGGALGGLVVSTPPSLARLANNTLIGMVELPTLPPGTNAVRVTMTGDFLIQGAAEHVWVRLREVSAAQAAAFKADPRAVPGDVPALPNSASPVVNSDKLDYIFNVWDNASLGWIDTAPESGQLYIVTIDGISLAQVQWKGVQISAEIMKRTQIL